MPDSPLTGMRFTKMTGSGNDFVFFDSRDTEFSLLSSPEVIQAICNRHNGIGADGIVVLEPVSSAGDARIHYFNSDGTPADLCGNATLCSTSMAAELGIADASGMSLLTPAGEIRSRLTNGLPEIDLQPVHDVRSEMAIELTDGERRVGFAVAGIPHLILLCDDADAIDLTNRGPVLRRHPSLGAPGANVNWVSARADGSWRYRTFERGVEGETLACGTGAVATGILLATWGLTVPPVRILTSSGRQLEVSLRREEGMGGAFLPTLKGEGRVVFRGRIATLNV